MPNLQITLLFIGTIVIGLIASIFASRTLKYTIRTAKPVVMARFIAILLMTFAFSLHTAGDFFGSLYNDENIEHMLESIAHVMLAVAFIIFLSASRKILKISREYGFVKHG